jgi:phosphatidylserine synthase
MRKLNDIGYMLIMLFLVYSIQYETGRYARLFLSLFTLFLGILFIISKLRKPEIRKGILRGSTEAITDIM